MLMRRVNLHLSAWVCWAKTAWERIKPPFTLNTPPTEYNGNPPPQKKIDHQSKPSVHTNTLDHCTEMTSNWPESSSAHCFFFRSGAWTVRAQVQNSVIFFRRAEASVHHLNIRGRVMSHQIESLDSARVSSALPCPAPPPPSPSLTLTLP